MAYVRKPYTKEEMKVMQFGKKNVEEWGRIHNLAQMIKKKVGPRLSKMMVIHIPL